MSTDQSINNAQMLIDALAEAGRRERSNYHLTYGGLIEVCRKAPAHVGMSSESRGISAYRGFYTDIALCLDPELSFPGDGIPTCHAFADWLEGQIGKNLQGYKGGEYEITADKPLWLADDYSHCSGIAVVDTALRFGLLRLITKVVRP